LDLRLPQEFAQLVLGGLDVGRFHCSMPSLSSVWSTSTFPICRPSLLKCDCQHLDLLVHDSIDDAVRKPIEQVPLRAEEARPALRRLDDLRNRRVYCEDEFLTEPAAASFVEACTMAEVEARLVMNQVRFLRSRHGARRGSRP